MNSYLQGMITGGVMIFSIIIFMGQVQPLKLQNNQYDPNEALRQRQLEIQNRKNVNKKRKVDSQKEKVRKSQLKVDKQTLENPIGKYITGINADGGKLRYWVTDTQTSWTYVATMNPETNSHTYWGFTYDGMVEKLVEQRKKNK